MNNSERQTQRIEKARKNLEEMQKIIAPFVRQRALKQQSTAGGWRKTSSLVQMERR
jgi:hypothetical protein